MKQKTASSLSSIQEQRRKLLAGLAALGIAYAAPSLLLVSEAQAYSHYSRRSRRTRRSYTRHTGRSYSNYRQRPRHRDYRPYDRAGHYPAYHDGFYPGHAPGGFRGPTR